MQNYFFVVCWAFCLTAKAQFNYQYDYLFPVNPKQKALISGGIGEIRANHFHAGLDIVGITGTKIYAAADGYVYMLRPSTYGYGNFIFLMHPESNQRTLYAHLDAFAEPFATYVKQKQYEAERFDIDIFPPKDLFPIKKGDLIGYIGNTGASVGSHLHYEIRTLDDVALNPLKFTPLSEVNDNIPPVFTQIAFQPLEASSLVNQSGEKYVLQVQKVANGQYIFTNIPKVHGTFGVEVITYDLIDYSGFTVGTTKLKLLLDGQEIFSYDLNQIPHLYNRCMNVHLDYATYKQKYQAFQRCYVQDGNLLGAYRTNKYKGKITLRDTQKHIIELQAEDSAGNISILKGEVQGYKPTKPIFQVDFSPYQQSVSHQIQENFLLIEYHYPKQKADSIVLSFAGIVQKVPFKYQTQSKAVYCWDLRKGLPDYAQIGTIRYPFTFAWIIPSQRDFMYQEEDLAIRFDKNTLFDTLYLELKRDKQTLTIGNPLQPVFNHFEVAWKRPAPSQPAKQWAIYLQENGINYYQETEWKQDSALTFKSNTFGTFALLKDDVPPTIRLASKSDKQIACYISDNLSGIAHFRATLNGEFLLMKYESKNAYIWSERKDESKPLQGKFVLEVTDKAGNTTKFETILP
ncbi:MAG: M23 family metallopeptidase [Microscillaceae bacterium]|nr:M23 family metallopeptidase [Microscillaceae bacterium]MDW8459736.1 M23 family metallopeptidase [Cytophagales bacterium]